MKIETKKFKDDGSGPEEFEIRKEMIGITKEELNYARNKLKKIEEEDE